MKNKQLLYLMVILTILIIIIMHRQQNQLNKLSIALGEMDLKINQSNLATSMVLQMTEAMHDQNAQPIFLHPRPTPVGFDYKNKGVKLS